MDEKTRVRCFKDIIKYETIPKEPIKSYDNFISAALEKYYIEKLTFKAYIIFMCSRNKRRDILIIQQFRKKLLSEEHLFKSHLFLYLILIYIS